MELYRWLKLERPTDEAMAAGEKFLPGTCHHPEYAEEYFKQLTAEKRVIKLHKGFPRASWEKDPTRNNEALDCRVYARAAASIYGLDRFTDRQWQQIEVALGKMKTYTPHPAEQPEDSTITPQSPPRQTTTKPIEQRRIIKADDPYL